jgi:hypothetical protein
VISIRRSATNPRLSARGLRIPFLSTSPLSDVRLLFFLLPLWWLLGIEQFVFFPLLTYSAVKLLVSQRSIKYQPTLLLLILFGTISLLSLARVDEPLRYVSFIRNLISYLTFTLLFFVITNTVRTWKHLQSLIAAVVLSMGIVGILGVAASLNIFRPLVITPIGFLLPDTVANTDLGERVLRRTLGNYSWFSYLGQYYRIRATFLYATMYAAALAMTIPLAVLCMEYANQWRTRLLYGLIVMILLWNLFFTTGRMGWVALVAGGTVWLVMNQRISLLVRAPLMMLGVLGALAIFGLYGANATDEAVALLDARGSSTSDRLRIYKSTIKGIVESPYLGWGTERDLADLPYPAGSHSYFLGVVYRHGIPAFVLFLSIWALTAWKSVSSASLVRHRGMNCLRWSLIAAFMISMTEVLDLDTVTLMVLATVLASIHATERLVRLQRVSYLASQAEKIAP